MVVVLYLWILFYLSLAGGAGYGTYRAVKRLRARSQDDHILQGKANARLLMTRRRERCSLCEGTTDPTHDAWDEKLGWYHPDCYDKLIDD